MKKIYIIQTYSKTIPSRFVRIITNYRYSHVGICMDINCNKIYTFGRKEIHNFLNGGFILETKDGPFYKKYNDTICKIYELNVSDDKYLNLRDILDKMCENKDMYKYDFIGAFFNFFKMDIKFDNKYTCSQFVAEMLEKSDIYKFEKSVNFVKPKDFDKIRSFKKIYEGLYQKY